MFPALPKGIIKPKKDTKNLTTTYRCQRARISSYCLQRYLLDLQEYLYKLHCLRRRGKQVLELLNWMRINTFTLILTYLTHW
jgi:hypothetical protein